MFPDAAGNMRLQVDTFSGKLQPAVPQARVHLRVEFITSGQVQSSKTSTDSSYRHGFLL